MIVHVEISFKVGFSNSVDSSFYIHERNFERDLKDITNFLNYAFKDERHNDSVITITEGDDNVFYLENSKRFILTEYNNGFQERPYNSLEKGYIETASKTFGTEGSARQEMKKAVIKSLKQILKRMENVV
ncbi:hypothetical protein MKY96_33435 [Paenibacillus sp. FSL R7-0302]|uniref:hypothetical protein n=1 Tax=Paenibacillus sp. FSL R7-0302 TaxID=2921681 RepID=UPI0030F5A298